MHTSMPANQGFTFDAKCTQCPRLANFLAQIKSDNKNYFCQPVPPFGDTQPQLFIVGLAPGMHGANRTGRPFTGDYAGVLLYQTLHQFGYASAPVSVAADDGLTLIGCRISNAVKCLPPENKPTPQEINTCNTYLAAELTALQNDALILALGNIAHQAVLKALKQKIKDYKFAHAARHVLSDGRILYDSYHCSRYNTQTKRLTDDMFQKVFAAIRYETENMR